MPMIAFFDNFHGGVDVVRSTIQQGFHIFRLCNAVVPKTKSICVFCRKFRSAVKRPVMGDLPAEILDAQSYPLVKSGVKYFSPFGVETIPK